MCDASGIASYDKRKPELQVQYVTPHEIKSQQYRVSYIQPTKLREPQS